MKTWSIVFGFLLLCAVAGISSIYLIFRTERTILARFQEPKIGEVLILAESEDRFEEWAIMLYWRKPKSYWMEYLLERQVSLWKTAGLVSNDSRLVIFRNGKEFGYLDIRNGKFIDEVYNYTDHRPISINLSDDPFSRVNRIFPESPTWTSVWPHVLYESTETSR